MKELDVTKMEVFDRVTERKYRLTSATLRLDVKGSRVRINASAVALFDLHGANKDLGCKFVRFKKTWYCSVSAESNAYAVTLETKHRAGATIGAAVVMQQILADTRKSEFYLQETDHELAGHRLYELLPVPDPEK